MSRKTKQRIGNTLFAVVLGILAFLAAVPAFAQTLVTADPDVGALVTAFLGAVGQHQYSVLVGLALIALVTISHKVGVSKIFPWFATDGGAAAYTFLCASLLTVGTALAGKTAFSWGLVWTALSLSATAAGGYTLLRKLLGTNGGLGRWFPALAKVADALGPANPPIPAGTPAK